MSSVLRGQVEDFESLFSFTIGGIEEHMQTSEPETDRIVGALLALDAQLVHVLDEYGGGVMPTERDLHGMIDAGHEITSEHEEADLPVSDLQKLRDMYQADLENEGEVAAFWNVVRAAYDAGVAAGKMLQ